MKKLIIMMTLIVIVFTTCAHAETLTWDSVPDDAFLSWGLTSNYSLNADDGIMEGAFMRSLYINGTNTGLVWFTKDSFDPGVGGSVSVPVRWHNSYWWGFLFYDGEAEYYGIEAYNTGGNLHFLVMDSGGSRYDTGISCSIDTKYDLKVTWDGGTGYSCYVNGSLIGSGTLPSMPAAPMHIYICSIASSSSSSVDWGPMSLTGDTDTVSWAGDEDFMLWSTTNGFSSEVGPEGTWGGSFYGLQYCGGLTAKADSTCPKQQCLYSTDIKVVSVRNSTHTPVYDSGVFDAQSPIITPPFGRQYSQLKLWGLVRSGGTLKVYVRDVFGNLISDTQLPGNSSGLAYGWPATYSLSAVTAGSIYLDAQGANPGSITLPVILNGASVTFADMPIVQGNGPGRGQHIGGGSAAAVGGRNVSGGSAGAGGTRHINGGGA